MIVCQFGEVLTVVSARQKSGWSVTNPTSLTTSSRRRPSVAATRQAIPRRLLCFDSLEARSMYERNTAFMRD